MKPDEFYEKMLWISRMEDTERAHIEADELMCEALTSLGYEVGVEIFKIMNKWYS